MRASLHFCTAMQRTKPQRAGERVGLVANRHARRRPSPPQEAPAPQNPSRAMPIHGAGPAPDVDMHIPATVLHIIRLITPRLPNCRRGMRPSWSEIASSRYPHPPYSGFLYMKPLFFETIPGIWRANTPILAYTRVLQTLCDTDSTRFRATLTATHSLPTHF